MPEKSAIDYSVVFHASVNGMAFTEIDSGKIVDVNAQWLRATGIPRERALGRTAFELGLWENPDDRAACLAELQQKGRLDAFETRLIMRGVTSHFLISAQVIEFDERQHVMWELRDISALKQAEGAQAYVAAIVDSIDDAIISRGMDRTVLSWNRAAERMFGYSAAEAIGRSIAFLIPPEREDESAWARSQVVQGIAIIDMETVRMRKDGSRVDVSMTSSPVRDERGQVVSIALIFRDITERKRKAALIELLESLARATNEAATVEQGLQACLDRICEYGGWQLGHVGLFAAGQSSGVTKVTYWRCEDAARFGEFMRLTDDHVRSQHGGAFLSRAVRESRAVWIEDVAAVLSDSSVQNSRLRNAYRCGVRSAFVFPVFVDRQIAGFLEFFSTENRVCDKDLLDASNSVASQLARVIERGRAAEQLEQMNVDLEMRVARRTAELEAANEELNSFSYTIAHDMRAPIRAINGFSEMVLQANDGRLDEKTVGHLRRVVAGSRHMSELIDDLLNLARLSRQEMTRCDTDLSLMARRSAAALADAAPARHVELVIQPDIMAFCDPGLLRPVLDNLIGNAWKFTGKTAAPRIEFGTETRDGWTAYYVRDNGVGFDMQYVHKLFAPFQRLHHANEFEGTGIGLATVKKIIQRHDGKVWIESAPGAGTTVYFTVGG